MSKNEAINNILQCGARINKFDRSITAYLLTSA